MFIIFLESQKEQQILLSLQRDKLKLETQEEIQRINEQSVIELQKWKHDIKHIFNLIDYQIINKQYAQMKETIHDANHFLDENQLITLTNNDLLDYLLSQKANQIKDNHIHFIVSYSQCICPLSDVHFCMIIGNLLDNAIENCTSRYKKQIYLSIEQKTSFFSIKIKNTIEEFVLQNNPNLITTKEDTKEHGIGLQNIQVILDQYQGKISFHEDNDYFIVNIIIPINQ